VRHTPQLFIPEPESGHQCYRQILEETALSFKNYKPPRRVVPATISLIASVLLIVVCAFLVSNRFRDPEIKTAEQAEHSTTGIVARRAGAQLSPTQPKLAVEPAGPKTEQPADHPAPELAPR
jgi:hypothetical protein